MKEVVGGTLLGQPNVGVAAPSDFKQVLDAAGAAIAASRAWFMPCQHEDGYWCAKLEGDTILDSERPGSRGPRS
jgi:hypothetical protein